jgi:hypothetical protein
MSKYLENKLSMFDGVRTFLKSIVDKTSAIPALAAAITEFDQVVDQLKAKGLEVDTVSAGKAQKKADAEDDLIDAIIPVKSALASFASSMKNPELIARANVTESQLRKMRDTDLEKKAEGILQAGTDNLTAAADHGLTQALLTALAEKSKAFSAASGDREASVGKRVGARSAMMDLYDKADAILTERIDNLMELMRKSEPQLCEEYNSTRLLREAGLRHKPVAPPEQQQASTQAK